VLAEEEKTDITGRRVEAAVAAITTIIEGPE
jgi:hypothetical protein